ncbi:IS3 family transposase [Streptomyces sp. PU_AKi4]|uniref:IS3 family transposase n=1 Tax=Streptomyces sp. PU_AKi4 TaxID=2800809 RepID=UPI0035233EE8
MGSIGDSYDNALAENLWMLIKTEGPRGRTFATRAEANLALFEYIDGFYNSRRIQKRLGYLSPVEFEEQHYAEQAATERANLKPRQPCPETHSPTPIKHPVTQAYLDFIDRTGSDHFKLLIDTGVFQTAPVDDGHEGFEGKKRPAFLEPLAVPMSDLADVLPHVHFIQAKFFEIDDHLDDLHIPWHDILTTLRTAGWRGWLSSEYEGRRETYRDRDQVRRQHALLRSLNGSAGLA